MPQLNPAPWLLTLIVAWVALLWLLHLTVKLISPSNPNKPLLTHRMAPWAWTWQ